MMINNWLSMNLLHQLKLSVALLPLGTIAKPNYLTILASTYDPYAISTATHLIQTTFPINPNASNYVKNNIAKTFFLLNLTGLWLQIPKNLLKIIFLLTFTRFLKILVKT